MSLATDYSSGEAEWVPADTFALRLVRLRRHLNRASQDEAAALCNINPKTWATWELGTSPRNMGEVVQRIHRATGCNPRWLMWGDEAISPCFPEDAAHTGIRDVSEPRLFDPGEYGPRHRSQAALVLAN